MNLLHLPGQIRLRQPLATSSLQVVKSFHYAPSPVNYIEFTSFDAHGDLCDQGNCSAVVALGTKVLVIDCNQTSTPPLEISSHFSTTVHCCRYRSDGKLFLTTDADGKVRVHRSTNKQPLRTYRHKQAVRRAVFMENKTSIVSAGFDRMGYHCDLSSDEPVRIWNGMHNDIISVVEVSDGVESAFDSTVMTGSGDGLVKFWDIREASERSCKELEQGEAVSAAQWRGWKVYTAAGKTMRVWDIRQPKAEIVEERSHHLSQITDLGIAKESSGQVTVLTVSTDKCMKLASLGEQFRIQHSILHNGPLSACAVSDNDKFLLAGSENGDLQLYLTTRPPVQEAAEKPDTDKTKLHQMETLTSTKRHAKLPPAMEVLIRQYQYHKALQESLKLDSVQAFAAVIEELLNRDALDIAMRGKTVDESKDLLNFFIRRLESPNAALHGFVLQALAAFLRLNSDYLSQALDQSLVETLNPLLQALETEQHQLSLMQNLSDLLLPALIQTEFDVNTQ